MKTTRPTDGHRPALRRACPVGLGREHAPPSRSSTMLVADNGNATPRSHAILDP